MKESQCVYLKKKLFANMELQAPLYDPNTFHH